MTNQDTQPTPEQTIKEENSRSVVTRTWRYIPFKKYDPFLKIALNDVALNSVSQSGTPIVWIAGWEKNCVCVGQQQKISDVVNLQETKKRGITIIRRQGKGSALYLDSEGELSWAVIVPNEIIPKEINDIYKIYTEKVCDALAAIGIEAYAKSAKDVQTTLGKISALDIKRERYSTYIGGTLIYAVNVDAFRSVLCPEYDLTSEKRVPEKYKPITSVSMEAEKTKEETIQALTESLLNKATFRIDSWSSQELSDAQTLAQKYSGKEWLHYNE